MKVNSVNSNYSARNQNFGVMLKMKPKVFDFYKNNVFKDDTENFDKFISYIEGATIDQENNIKYDTEVTAATINGVLVPGVNILNRDFGKIVSFNPTQEKYKGLSQKDSVFQMIADAVDRATDLLDNISPFSK